MPRHWTSQRPYPAPAVWFSDAPGITCEITADVRSCPSRSATFWLMLCVSRYAAVHSLPTLDGTACEH